MDYDKRHKELMLPCLRVRAGKAGGSGTIIYSKENKDSGEFSTFALTNHHVVANIIEIKEQWSPLRKRQVKTDVLGTPHVEMFEYKWGKGATGSRMSDAEIVAYDPNEDLALLKLDSAKAVDSVAKLYPRGEEDKLRATMPVYAVGAALGNPPVITEGMISQFGIKIAEVGGDKEFWLSTCPTIFGNSGGALFKADTHEFLGVPSRIQVLFMGFAADAITHLSFQIPITRVYDFLEKQYFRFIYDSSFTEESEAGIREEIRKEEEYKLARKDVEDGSGRENK